MPSYHLSHSPAGGNINGTASLTISNNKGGSNRKSMPRRKGSKLGLHMNTIAAHVRRSSVGSPRNEIITSGGSRYINHQQNNRLVMMFPSDCIVMS